MMIVVQMLIYITERITVIMLSTEQQCWVEQQLEGGRQWGEDEIVWWRRCNIFDDDDDDWCALCVQLWWELSYWHKNNDAMRWSASSCLRLWSHSLMCVYSDIYTYIFTFSSSSSHPRPTNTPKPSWKTRIVDPNQHLNVP